MARRWYTHIMQWAPLPIVEAAARLRWRHAVITSPNVERLSLLELYPVFRNTEVVCPVGQLDRVRDAVLPLADLLAIAAICRGKSPQRIFEIGTHAGSTTLLMAMNTPDDTEIFTLDLQPDHISYRFRNLDGTPMYRAGSDFMASRYATKIRQLFGHSGHFDFSPFWATIDLVFIDGEHSYEAVKHDTFVAQQLIRPGGMIIWDDYLWFPHHPNCRGVARFLDEFGRKERVISIGGTRLALTLPLTIHHNTDY